MEISPRTHLIDVEYLGEPRGIAACVLETDGGLALVDPGPTSSLAGLERGLETIGCSTADVRDILLTHIHLDHAGATGVLVRENPHIRVHVHERGAAHVIDPSRLRASALRIYGDALDRLFGEFAAVPADHIHVLRGGESIDPGGRKLRVEYSPGHAWHHVAYLDEDTGTVFVGDTAGERFAPHEYVLPVTPPPDIDLEQWRDTVNRIRALQPVALFITHFGAFADVVRHLDEHEARLAEWAARVRDSLQTEGSDDDRAARFTERIETELRTELGADGARHYLAAGIRESWVGLARYWRKRTGSLP